MSENLNQGNPGRPNGQGEPVNLGKKPVRPAGQKAGAIKRPNPNGAPKLNPNGAQGAPQRQGGAPKRPVGAPVKGQPQRGNAPEPVLRSENAGQRPQRAPQQPQGQRRNPQQRPPQRQPMPRRGAEPRPRAAEATESFGSVVRGIIALGITCFAVCVIVIMFAKSLFVSDAELQKTAKTGHLTETAFEVVEPKQQLRDEVVTTKATKKKKTTTAEAEAPEERDDLPEGLDTSIAGMYTINNPVYLHPIADANSANLATIPYGEQINVLGQSFGWYYVEFEGQQGYAWGTFFTKN